jgi:hypothetical protein
LRDLGRYAQAQEHLLRAEPFLRTAQSTHAECVEDIVKLYDAWHTAEPDRGYNAKAAEWRAKLEDWRASTQPTRTTPGSSQPATTLPTLNAP